MRVVIPGTFAHPPRPPRPYAEFALGFVLLRAAIESGSAGSRLDAIEGTLGQLMRQWRGGDRLSAARDIRIAPATLAKLLHWLEGGAADADAIARMAVYASGAVADASVPRGWIRVYMGGERPGPAPLRLHREG